MVQPKPRKAPAKTSGDRAVASSATATRPDKTVSHPSTARAPIAVTGTNDAGSEPVGAETTEKQAGTSGKKASMPAAAQASPAKGGKVVGAGKGASDGAHRAPKPTAAKSGKGQPAGASTGARKEQVEKTGRKAPGNTKGKEKAAVEDKDKDIEGGCNGKGAEEQDGDAVQSDEDGEGEEEVEEEDDVEEASESVGKGERATQKAKARSVRTLKKKVKTSREPVETQEGGSKAGTSAGLKASAKAKKADVAVADEDLVSDSASKPVPGKSRKAVPAKSSRDTSGGDATEIASAGKGTGKGAGSAAKRKAAAKAEAAGAGNKGGSTRKSRRKAPKSVEILESDEHENENEETGDDESSEDGADVEPVRGRTRSFSSAQGRGAGGNAAKAARAKAAGKAKAEPETRAKVRLVKPPKRVASKAAAAPQRAQITRSSTRLSARNSIGRSLSPPPLSQPRIFRRKAESSEEDEDNDNDNDNERSEKEDNNSETNGQDDSDYDIIDPVELAEVTVRIQEYMCLVPLPVQSTKSARKSAISHAGWHCSGRQHTENGDMVYDVFSGAGANMGPICVRYYHELRLLNRYITWHAKIVQGIENVLDGVPCPWGGKKGGKRPDSITDAQDPWDALEAFTWSVNSAHAVRTAAMKWSVKYHEDDNMDINPWLHIWATAYFWVPTNFMLSSTLRLDEKLMRDPQGYDWIEWAKRNKKEGLFGRDAVISLGNEQDPMECRAQLNALDLPESETDEDLKLAIDSLGDLAMQLASRILGVEKLEGVPEATSSVKDTEGLHDNPANESSHEESVPPVEVDGMHISSPMAPSPEPADDQDMLLTRPATPESQGPMPLATEGDMVPEMHVSPQAGEKRKTRASSDASTKSARAPPETRAAGQGGTSAPSAPHSVIASTSGKAGNNIEMTDDLMEGRGAFLTGTVSMDEEWNTAPSEQPSTSYNQQTANSNPIHAPLRDEDEEIEVPLAHWVKPAPLGTETPTDDDTMLLFKALDEAGAASSDIDIPLSQTVASMATRRLSFALPKWRSQSHAVLELPRSPVPTEGKSIQIVRSPAKPRLPALQVSQGSASRTSSVTQTPAATPPESESEDEDESERFLNTKSRSKGKGKEKTRSVSAPRNTKTTLQQVRISRETQSQPAISRQSSIAAIDNTVVSLSLTAKEIKANPLMYIMNTALQIKRDTKSADGSRRVALPEDAKRNIVTLLKTLNAFLEEKDMSFKYRIRSLRVNDKNRSDMESGMKRIMQHMKVYISDLPKETLIQGPKIYKALVLNDWLY